MLPNRSVALILLFCVPSKYSVEKDSCLWIGLCVCVCVCVRVVYMGMYVMVYKRVWVRV